MKGLAPYIICCFSFSLYGQDASLQDIEVTHDTDSQRLVDFAPSGTDLAGEKLNRKRQTSLGDMLRTEAGVETTYFGPNSSRPVIRGLDGDRIRILQNSLGTLDASAQSVDHAIPVDVLTIDKVEILRGPMSLLFGATAVGGVVNLLTNRIHPVYEEGFFSKFLVQGETVNNGLSSGAHLNYGVNNWMLHLDGSTRNLGDVEVPGSKEEKLSNSFNKQDNIAVAASRIFDRGYVGASFNHYNTRYGTVANDEVSIDMTQNRYELHSDFRPQGGPFRKLRLRSSYSNYFHKELEGDEVGTTFDSKGNETRLEAYNTNKKWAGITGVHTRFNDFSATGEEAFLPSSDNRMLALFSFQELKLNKKNALRFGGRVEENLVEKNSSEEFGAGDERNFLGWSASAGHLYDFKTGLTLESSVSYTERAPTFQELYSDGEHVATATFERGDSTLSKERATAFELILRKRDEKNVFTGSLYTQSFQDYVALLPTGTQNNDVDVYDYEQTDAIFYGLDFDNRLEIGKLRKGSLFFLTLFDYVRAKDTNSGDNLARITPPRLTLGLEYVKDLWTFDLSSQYVAHQTKTAPNESSTDDFILTDIGYSYHLVQDVTSYYLFARLRNIFDVEARSHVSTLKEIAPLPGRNLVVGAQVQF